MKGMREAVIDKFCEMAENNVNFNVLVSDSTSTSKLSPFQKAYPERVINVGIAEQNLIGMAAGLSLGGIPAVTANATPFLIARSNEQVKNDICYTNTNVKLIGLNPGFAYGPLGPTHHALDDISIMRSLGNIQIFSPGDPLEAAAIAEYAVKTEGPMYIRLDSLNLPEINKKDFHFIPGAVQLYKPEGEIAIIALGTSAHDALKASELLEKKNVSTKVIGLPSIRPLDKESLIKELSDVQAVVTVEEHSLHGGLGSLVSDLMMETGLFKKMKKLGVTEGEFAPADPRGDIKKHYSLDAEGIALTVEKLIGEK